MFKVKSTVYSILKKNMSEPNDDVIKMATILNLNKLYFSIFILGLFF